MNSIIWYYYLLYLPSYCEDEAAFHNKLAISVQDFMSRGVDFNKIFFYIKNTCINQTKNLKDIKLLKTKLNGLLKLIYKTTSGIFRFALPIKHLMI
jgi:hypothetical protein